MASGRTILSQTNNIVYVEPNYNHSINGYDTRGLETFEFAPNLEDYSIYVNLEIETIGRTIDTGNKVYRFSYVSRGGDESVNLMGGSKIYTSDGNSINSLTTNYTDYHITDLKDVGASPELFGINYIDIAYNNFMVPEVTIEFTDIRGAAVFGQRELFDTNNRERAIGGNYSEDVVNTFFQCFFTFPYPKFTLLVKGFYGEPVAYELTCADFRARFNSDSGNFSCTAKFVGYYFSFLNDVMLNALVAAPYSDFIGAEYWSEKAYKMPGINGGEVDIPKIGYLLKIMKNAETAAEQISQSSPEVQEKNNLEETSERYSTIKRLYETYVNAIKNLVLNQTAENGVETFITDVSDNNISEAAIILVSEDANGETFEDYFDDDDGSVNGAYESLITEIESFSSQYNDVKFPSLDNFAEAKPKQRIYTLQQDETKCIADVLGVNEDIIRRSKTLFDTFNKKVLNRNSDSTENAYKNFQYAYFFNDKGFTEALNNAMADASKKQTDLAEKIASNKANAIAERLGFRPSVENVTKIMMAHFETFAYMVYKTAILIDEEQPERDTKKVGITDDDDVADVPEKYRSAETKQLLVPPFPKVTKIVEKQGVRNREESWVGDYGNMFRETDLVHGILNGIEEFVKMVSASENAGAAGSTSSVDAVMAHPLSPLDFVATKDIYDSFDQSEVSSLLGLVTLRALQILGTTNFSDWTDNCKVLGEAEAENLLAAEKLSDGLKEKLKPLAENVDSVMQMIEGRDTSDIQKPSSGMWPWESSSENTAIAVSGEFNICKTTGLNGSTTYMLPLQKLNWDIIKKAIESKSAASSEDFFNISDTLITNNYKDNIFNIETNIERIKNIAEKQLTSPEGIDFYRDKILGEATYDADNYKDLFDNDDLVVYPIKDAGKLLPKDKSCMLPCTKNYLKQMSWGGGYDMDNFEDVDLGGNWYDKDSNEVTRISDDGFEDFLKDLDTNKYTITEIPGLTETLEPTDDTSLFTEQLYYEQTDDRVKGFMLLCSLGYLYDYEDIIEDYICEKDKTISIIPLPAVIYAGGIIWAKSHLWRSDVKEDYVEKYFKHCELNDDIDDLYEDYLSLLDPQVKLKFSKTFERWINEGVQNNDLIVSFKKIKECMEFKLVKNRSYDDFFNGLGEIQDKKWYGADETWFNNGVFAGNGYKNMLDFFVGELDENFFRNYICIDEDLGGSKSDKTVGFRVGNRDGSPGVKHLVDFALAPCSFMKNSKFFFNETEKRLKVETGHLKTFLEGFLERIAKETKEETKDNAVSQAKETDTTTDIKVGVYRYCKLLYDKWIGGINDTDFEKYTMPEFFDNDTKYFHFIDAYYNYANDITINISSFCDMIKESYESADYSLLSFLSTVYSQNKFNMFCVQNFVDISKKENMIRMFDCVPYTDIKWDSIQKHPNFIINYAYEASSHLEMNNSEYENDGFMINQQESASNKWPEALKSRNAGVTSGLNVPAFGVSYGKMYQSYFKDVSVSMDNPVVTEQSIKAQFAIACLNNEKDSQSDESKEYTYGQDLYSIYSNNSYECDVTMMGCAWVQPLMLFVLNNVPMFRGTYQIINVTHRIEQGNMTTRFKGVRMANVATRLVEENNVTSKSTQTDAGVNTEVNQESLHADVDNDCAYSEYPLSMDGVAGGGIPESFLKTNYHEFCGGNINKYKQEGRDYGEGKEPAKSWLTSSERTIGEVLCAGIAAEYKGFPQNNRLMLRVASAMVCNKYHWCKKHNKWVYLFGTLQQGTGNRAATEATYNEYKDIVMPVFINGPGCLVGETTKVQQGCNVEMWNYGKTEHKKAPDTHVITEDDMRSVYAYCTMGGYDYEHIGQFPDKVGSQTWFETKAIPNNGKSLWKKARFLFQEYNSVFTSHPDDPDGKFWEPAPKIVNNGDDKVSPLANGFLHALNQTSQSSAVNVEIGIDKNKSDGDTIYLTNAKNSQDFGKVLDMMLQAYSSKIEEIRWLVPGDNGNQSVPPAAYIVSLKEGSTFTLVKVVNESNNELVSDISMENEGGINKDFKKAIVKKYKDESNKEEKVGKYVMPAMDKDKIEKLFKENEIQNCSTVMGSSSGGEDTNVPVTGDNSTWINAVQTMGKWYQTNVHTYQSSPPGQKGKARKHYKCTIGNWNGNVADDCSGYVSACLQYFGKFKNGFEPASCGFTTDKNVAKILQDGGFTKMNYSWANVQPYDIISYCGHVEILAQKGDNPRSWGWGSVHDGLNGRAGMPAGTGNKPKGDTYKVIWRYLG